jgi:hypothetical protein
MKISNFSSQDLRKINQRATALLKSHENIIHTQIDHVLPRGALREGNAAENLVAMPSEANQRVARTFSKEFVQREFGREDFRNAFKAAFKMVKEKG